MKVVGTFVVACLLVLAAMVIYYGWVALAGIALYAYLTGDNATAWAYVGMSTAWFVGLVIKKYCFPFSEFEERAARE